MKRQILLTESSDQSDTVPMQKTTPFLWFDGQAGDAANFYTSLFKNSNIGRIFRYTEEAAEKTCHAIGSVQTIEFEMEGQKFVGLNRGPLLNSMNPFGNESFRHPWSQSIENRKPWTSTSPV